MPFSFAHGWWIVAVGGLAWWSIVEVRLSSNEAGVPLGAFGYYLLVPTIFISTYFFSFYLLFWFLPAMLSTSSLSLVGHQHGRDYNSCLALTRRNQYSGKTSRPVLPPLWRCDFEMVLGV